MWLKVNSTMCINQSSSISCPLFQTKVQHVTMAPKCPLNTCQTSLTVLVSTTHFHSISRFYIRILYSLISVVWMPGILLQRKAFYSQQAPSVMSFNIGLEKNTLRNLRHRNANCVHAINPIPSISSLNINLAVDEFVTEVSITRIKAS